MIAEKIKKLLTDEPLQIIIAIVGIFGVVIFFINKRSNPSNSTAIDTVASTPVSPSTPANVEPTVVLLQQPTDYNTNNIVSHPAIPIATTTDTPNARVKSGGGAIWVTPHLDTFDKNNWPLGELLTLSGGTQLFCDSRIVGTYNYNAQTFFHTDYNGITGYVLSTDLDVKPSNL